MLISSAAETIKKKLKPMNNPAKGVVPLAAARPWNLTGPNARPTSGKSSDSRKARSNVSRLVSSDSPFAGAIRSDVSPP